MDKPGTLLLQLLLIFLLVVNVGVQELLDKLEVPLQVRLLSMLKLTNLLLLHLLLLQLYSTYLLLVQRLNP